MSQNHPVCSALRPIRSLLAWVVVAVASLCLCVHAQAEERRLALVIANSSYVKLGRLKNPVNDANLVSKALAMRGFEVMTGTNVRSTELNDLVKSFLEKARTADVSLFYYAGHAFQVSERNFLAPIDASLHSMEDVQSQTFEVQKILQGLQASGGLHLIFLDACRDNPFEAIGGNMPRTSDGLARIVSSSNLLISYATQPGNVARDGDGNNSPFARSIAEHMHAQGEDIGTMMIKVRADVIKATGGAQIPWDSSSLTRRFFFNPGAPKVAFLDTEVWQFARSLEEPEVLQAYIDRYPSAPHVDEAKAELRRLTVASLSDDTSGSRQLRINRLSEDSLWELAERTRIRAIAQTYVKRYPSGKYTETAMSYLHSSTFDETVGEQCERAATHPRDATSMFDGVPLPLLAQKVDAAIDLCERAMRENPGFAKYKALLARAYSIKDKARAVALYQQAATDGNLRAMVSLGLLKEAGDGVPKDVPGALRLYEEAADRGSADGAINLAVALMEGSGVAKNTQRAVALLKQAVGWGSGIAAYNLGAIAANCPAPGKQSKGECAQISGQTAASFFDQAVRLGFRRGFLALAILYDEGRGVTRDPARAADLLYQGASQDTGEIVEEFSASKPRPWNRDTVMSLQKRLSQAQHYLGPLDGKISPAFAEGLRNLRTYGG